MGIISGAVQLHLVQGYLSADIICSEMQTVFREWSSRKTVSFEEQIMSKDKYWSIHFSQMEAIVFIILQIFFLNAHSFENWGILSIVKNWIIG